MSSPISTIVVHTRTSNRPPRKSIITCSSRSSGICPCATATLPSASAQLLELFLVLDPASLLLVDDHEAELGEPHVLLKQPVGADDDIDGAGSDPVDHPALLDAAAKPAEHLHLHGIGGQPFEEDV